MGMNAKDRREGRVNDEDALESVSPYSWLAGKMAGKMLGWTQ